MRSRINVGERVGMVLADRVKLAIGKIYIDVVASGNKASKWFQKVASAAKGGVSMCPRSGSSSWIHPLPRLGGRRNKQLSNKGGDGQGWQLFWV